MKILLLRFKNKLIPNFFTCFEFQLKLKEQKVIKHKFDFLRSFTNCNQEVNNSTYFIGSNFSGAGILKEEDEINLLKRAFYFLNKDGKNIVYCAHRREIESKLQKIKNLNSDITILKSNMPIELEFLLKGLNVKFMSSLGSTVLFTASLLFETEECFLFNIPEDLILSNNENLANLKNEYSKIERIKIIENF